MNVSWDPLQYLGEDLYLDIILWLGNTRDITIAEAVHPAWRNSIRSHDRSIWQPVADSLGIQAEISRNLDGSQTRKACEMFCRRERNWRVGDCRSAPLVPAKDERAATLQMRTGVWRVKIDEHARVLYTTMRDEHVLHAIDIDTGKTLWSLPGVHAHTHIEFEDGYAVITEGWELVVMKTKRILDQEQTSSSTFQPAGRSVVRGELVASMVIEPPGGAAALRMRPRLGRAPELCSASVSEAFIWDVSNGSQTSHIEYLLDGYEERLSYVEFDENYVFLGLSYSLDIYDRRDSKRIARIATATHHGISQPLKLGFTVPVSNIEGPLRRSFPIELDHPTLAADRIAAQILPPDRDTKVHYTGTDLVVATNAGLIIVVTNYKKTLAKIASEDTSGSGASASLLDHVGVYVVRSNEIWEHLDVQGDYVILQSITGVFLLPLQPFHTGAVESGKGVLYSLSGDHSSAWTAHIRVEPQEDMFTLHGPSCVQSTADAIYYVHPFVKERACRYDFDVNVLQFKPE